MNYRCLLSLLFVALSLSVWAEQIPESTARQVAQHVLSGFNPLRATVSPVLAYQAQNSLRVKSSLITRLINSCAVWEVGERQLLSSQERVRI